METYEHCFGCDNTDIDNCKYCANDRSQRYIEANTFAEKTAIINLILLGACMALIVALVGVLIG